VGSLFPPHIDEITTLIDDLRDASRHEIITTNDQDEVRRSLPSKFEEKSGQGPLSLVVYFLGIFRVYQNEREITEWHSLKGRDILKYLLSRPGTPVIKDVLMDIFWPDVDPKAARRNLHQAIYSLRQSLRGEQPGFHHIWFENDCYFLNPQMNIWLDFREFENYIQVGRRLDTSGQLEDALAQYGMAEGLYQGDFLEEDLYEDWPMVQREQLLNLYLSTADKMGDYYLQNRQYAAAVSVCQKVLAKDRCYEAAHRRLMQCYLAQGQRHLAIRQYQTCLRSLKEELDIKPSEEIVELYLRISSQSIF
jgi:DNA-binding SARP family transcriptional activator